MVARAHCCLACRKTLAHDALARPEFGGFLPSPLNIEAVHVRIDHFAQRVPKIRTPRAFFARLTVISSSTTAAVRIDAARRIDVTPHSAGSSPARRDSQ